MWEFFVVARYCKKNLQSIKQQYTYNTHKTDEQKKVTENATCTYKTRHILNKLKIIGHCNCLQGLTLVYKWNIEIPIILQGKG